MKKGRLADLFLLDANPLEDIRNTAKINGVVVNSRFLVRKELDSILAEIARGEYEIPLSRWMMLMLM